LEQSLQQLNIAGEQLATAVLNTCNFYFAKQLQVGMSMNSINGQSASSILKKKRKNTNN